MGLPLGGRGPCRRSRRGRDQNARTYRAGHARTHAPRSRPRRRRRPGRGVDVRLACRRVACDWGRLPPSGPVHRDVGGVDRGRRAGRRPQPARLCGFRPPGGGGGAAQGSGRRPGGDRAGQPRLCGRALAVRHDRARRRGDGRGARPRRAVAGPAGRHDRAGRPARAHRGAGRALRRAAADRGARPRQRAADGLRGAGCAPGVGR
jgi:hypothetical protein